MATTTDKTDAATGWRSMDSARESNGAFIEMLVQAVAFADFAAGQGIAPAPDEVSAMDPANFISDFIDQTGFDPESCALADFVQIKLTAAFARSSPSNARAGTQENGWRDMATAPKDGTRVLLQADFGPCVGCWEDTGFWGPVWFLPCGMNGMGQALRETDVTGWMPLPTASAPPQFDIEERLRKLRRGLEMSASIMRDPERTGGWDGAERVARSYERFAKQVEDLTAASAPPQIDAIAIVEALKMEWCQAAEMATGIRFKHLAARVEACNRIITVLRDGNTTEAGR